MSKEQEPSACDFKIYNVDDFTSYHPHGDTTTRWLQQRLEITYTEGKTFSCDANVHLERAIKTAHGMDDAKGRLLACLCYGGRYWSFTFRNTGPRGDVEYVTHKRPGEGRPAVKSQYAPGPDPPSAGFLNNIADLCEVLYTPIFTDCAAMRVDQGGRAAERRADGGGATADARAGENGAEAQGLVIITGATASAKSQIVRGLIHKYLESRIAGVAANNLRRPHLVTFEDPIEKYYYEGDPGEAALQYGIDYTPRQREKDVPTLREALADALRQTPSAFYVGEVRNYKEDWPELIEFAGSGHLIFTTAHAGSLTEAMGRIFKATGTKTAAQRSEIAERLLALVHVKRGVVRGKKVLLPALWRSTPAGTKALVADGLASILPHTDNDASSLGRSWFAERLVTEALKRTEKNKGEEKGGNEVLRQEVEALRPDLKRQAIEWDIREV